MLRATTTLTALMGQRRTSRVLCKKGSRQVNEAQRKLERLENSTAVEKQRERERERGTRARTNTQTHKERHTQSTDESGERDKELTVNRATSSHS